MKKKTAVVICPGRGTYNKNELGYLHHYHSDKFEHITALDSFRSSQGRPSVWELDGRATFSPKEHLAGENAASLIYACSYADFLDINQKKIEIVAITGNSMGWYIALACAHALNKQNAIRLIDTMGSQMKDALIGGQIIYPEVDENWISNPQQSAFIDTKIKEANAFTSIHFGGYRVIGGDDEALRKLMKELPPIENIYPFKLIGNAAFHTPLLKDLSTRIKKELREELFSSPEIPLIDGRGKIWSPWATNRHDLWNYTLGHQVYQAYDFSTAIEVSIKEFSPDYLIITGPGMTLGGAVAQVIINKQLKKIRDKNEFKITQESSPYLLSMAQQKQREFVL
jgi:[acyl-carrier-protein] S-malonyltransferase